MGSCVLGSANRSALRCSLEACWDDPLASVAVRSIISARRRGGCRLRSGAALAAPAMTSDPRQLSAEPRSLPCLRPARSRARHINKIISQPVRSSNTPRLAPVPRRGPNPYFPLMRAGPRRTQSRAPSKIERAPTAPSAAVLLRFAARQHRAQPAHSYFVLFVDVRHDLPDSRQSMRRFVEDRQVAHCAATPVNHSRVLPHRTLIMGHIGSEVVREARPKHAVTSSARSPASERASEREKAVSKNDDVCARPRKAISIASFDSAARAVVASAICALRALFPHLFPRLRPAARFRARHPSKEEHG